MIQKTCNREDCTASGVNFDACMPAAMAIPYLQVGALLGPPDAWPTQGLVIGTYWVGCSMCGLQFFVVELEEPLYIQKVSVYETGSPGSIVALLATVVYLGNATEWVTLWEGIPVEGDFVGSIFKPSICPTVRMAARYVKVVFDTDIPGGSIAFDTIEFDGSIQPPTDMVWDDDGRLFYKPLDGVHFSSGHIFQDTVAVSVGICLSDDGLQISVSNTIQLAGDPAGVIPSTVFGEPQEVLAVTGEETYFQISFGDAQAHLSAALNEAIPESEFVVEVRPTIDTSLELFQADGTPIWPLSALGTEVVINKKKLLFSPGILLSTPGIIIRPTALKFEDAHLMLWVHARNVTYRTLLIVREICPMKATIFECTPLAQVCVQACALFPLMCQEKDGGDNEGVYSFYNGETGRCEVFSESTRKSRSVAIGAVAGSTVAVFIAATFVLFLMFPNRKVLGRFRILARGPPRSGEKITFVITDIQGSTTLWDLHPEQMARDIQLHHEVLRAHLKGCGGYEVATEGDSFKCVFHTPEDAVTYCTLVQIDLLTAPWSSELEAGGAEELRGKADWADIECSRLDRSINSILEQQIISLSGIKARKSKSGSGASLQTAPLFSPAIAAAQSFSKEWLASQAGSFAYASYRGTRLPVFRGLRVRMGIHSGVAEEVSTHTITKRRTYGGKVVRVAKAVSDTPCGGQIIMSGESLAEIASVKHLMAEVAEKCRGWETPLAHLEAPAGFSVMHLGSHIINKEPTSEEQMTKHIDLRDTLQGSALKAFASCEQTLKSSAVSLTDLKKLMLKGSEERGEIYPTPLVNAVNTEALAKCLEATASFKRGAHRLANAQELVMVLPWPLLHRARYYPNISSTKVIMSAWDKAPSGDGVTILFTFIPHMKQMETWQEMEGVEFVGKMIQDLHTQVRIELMDEDGYEVEGERGNFVCAFGTPAAAIRFAIKLQENLMLVDWSPEVLATHWACENIRMDGSRIFCGPRIAIGMSTMNAFKVQTCDRTGRMEYFGPVMNHSARVASAAHGGQVLVHESTCTCLFASNPESINPEIPEGTRFSDMGFHQLKGIASTTRIFQASTPGLLNRNFPAINTKSSSVPSPPELTKSTSVNVSSLASSVHQHVFGRNLSEGDRQEKGRFSRISRGLRISGSRGEGSKRSKRISRSQSPIHVGTVENAV